MSLETEEILVLYGSQTGNSEQAAIEISNQIPEKLSSGSKTKYTSRRMQLDDFLEIEKAEWTRNVIIVTSSYGVGAAPLGCYKFRAFCDNILEKEKQCSDLLDGIHFAMLGLGDSRYTTFFNNPTTIHKALLSAGAVQVGSLGKADAKGKGEDSQEKVIRRWIDGIWDPWKKVLNEQPKLTESIEEKLAKAKKETFSMSNGLLDTGVDSNEKSEKSAWSAADGMYAILAFSLLFAILGVILGKTLSQD